MVGVAQLAELPVVVRAVAGSTPVAHPNSFAYFSFCRCLFILHLFQMRSHAEIAAGRV